MIDVLTRGPIRFCDSLSRRQALQVGGLGALGLGLPALLSARSHAASKTSAQANAADSFGKAKRVILLFMWGGPAHQDTWDLKPHGPAATRGEFLPIGTNLSGIHISEHFPLIARQADKLAIIRSVGQEDNNHSTGAHAGLTGRRHSMQAENFGARDTDFPHFGSVLSQLRPNRQGMPPFVSLPDVIATTSGVITPGQFAGILGKQYDPFQITDHPDRIDFSIETLKLPGDVRAARMNSRRSLLEQIDETARLADRSPAAAAMDGFYRQALDMVLSPQARRAFDLSGVSDDERWRYGWHTFGQSVLLARRLIEAGVQLVTVYWHRERSNIDSSWDTHSRNFTEMKSRLMPAVDRPIAALLDDLQARGLLDETLIVWNSEFGRTPRINKNAGRDHWGPCNSVVLAGGGVPGGQVFGASDDQAAYPVSNKVTQDDIAATIYHLLGIVPETLIYDRLDRPFAVAEGEPIYELLGGRCRPAATSDPPPRADMPQVGPFMEMLRERARRFLCCDFGRSGGEAEWKLTGFSPPSGTGLERHRTLGDQPASVEYIEHFFSHLDYGYLVLRLAEPQALHSIKLSLNGVPLPIPRESADAEPHTLWHIPIPPGVIKATKTFALTIHAPGWKLTDLALVGDPILDLHLKRLEG